MRASFRTGRVARFISWAAHPGCIAETPCEPSRSRPVGLPVLPSLLQKISVASYLRHLMPVPVSSDGIFALLTVETEPVSGWAATAGLLGLIAIVLAYSCYRIRTLEIRYSTE